MNKLSIKLFLTSFLDKKFHFFLRKVVSFFVLIAFIATQSNVWASPAIYLRQTLQQPTMVSSWDIPGIKNKAAFTYINFHLREMEADPSNQNITSMEMAIRDVLISLRSNPDIPDEIKNDLPEEPELEGDSAVHVNFGGEVYIRYYNPDIYGSETASFTPADDKYDVEEILLNNDKDREVGYLCKQVMYLSENNNKSSWHNRKISFKVDKEKIRYNLDKIADSADSIMPFLLKASKSERYRDLSDLAEMKRCIGELKQSREAIDDYVYALHLFDEVIQEEDMNAEIFGRYLNSFYDNMSIRNDDSTSLSGDIKGKLDIKQILEELFSEEKEQFIIADPIGAAAEAYYKVLSAHEFYNYNHRISAFVLNYILVKNGYPYFSLKPSNMEQYYRKTTVSGVFSGKLNIDDIQKFFRVELDPDLFRKKETEELLVETRKVPGIQWYNRYIYARFPLEKQKKRIFSAIKLSGDVAEKILDEKFKRILPKTGDASLDEAVIERYKEMFSRGVANMDLDSYGRSMRVFEEMLQDTKMTLDKLEAYIKEFQRVNIGEQKSGYRGDPAYVSEEFRKILSELFEESGDKEIKEDIMFYVSVIFVEIMILHPFDNGNHRAADLVVNYILMKNGYAPFLMSEDNILRYYELFNHLDLGDWNFNMFEISEFFRSEVNKNTASEYLPESWNNIPVKKNSEFFKSSIMDNIFSVVSGLPKRLVKRLYLSKYYDMSKDEYMPAMQIFFKALEDEALTYQKLEKYIINFYSILHKKTFEDYINTYTPFGGIKRSTSYDIVKKLVAATVAPENRAMIVKDPIAFAVKTLHSILTADALIKGNQEVALFVLNLILVRNGYPYFLITRENIEKYYDMFSKHPIDKGKFSLIEMIGFFKNEINMSYQKTRSRNKSFGPALFVDWGKAEVRELENIPREIGKFSEHKALNSAIRKIIFERDQKPLDPEDPLVIFMSSLDNPAGKKVKIYIFKKKELRRELGNHKYIAGGLITHAGTNQGKDQNLFIPEYIYNQMLYLLKYEPMNKDIELILSLWGYHELEHIEKREDPDEALPEEIVKESAMQLWLYSNAKVRLLASKDIKNPKIKLKVLRDAAVLTKKALSYKRDYFFIRELDGQIYRDIGRITNNEKDYSQALSGFTIALSDLAMQEGTVIEDHTLVHETLDLLEIWSGKRADGVMPKKAKTKLSSAIKNILDPDYAGIVDAASIKKYKQMVEDQNGSDVMGDPFFAKFSMLPVVIYYLKKYQNNNPDAITIRNILLTVKKDIPKNEEDEEYEQKSKTWDDLKVKVYHFCGKIFMEKDNFNSWMDASYCFEKELECEQYYPEAYTLLVDSKLKVDRSIDSINSLRNIVEVGVKRLGKVDVLEAALNQINEVQNENDKMYAAIKKKFDEGDYGECLSDIKQIEKKYPHVKFSQRYIDLKNIAKKLKADKKAALRAIKEGKNEEAAAMLKEILIVNPTDIPVGEANVKVLVEIEEKERHLFVMDEHVSHCAGAKPVKTCIASADNYIKEAIRLAEVKGRILRARQRFDMAEEELIEARKLLDPVVFDDHDIQQFNAVILDVDKRIKMGRKKIEGLPDKIVVEKEEVKPEIKKRKKKKNNQKNKKNKVKPEPDVVKSNFVPKVLISSEVLKFLEESPDKDALTNNIVSGFGQILNNSFNRKKKWRSGKENMNISRMRLGRHYRLFYTPTSGGDLIALFIMRKSDSKYDNPKLKDIFPKGGSVDELISDALTLDEFKQDKQNSDILNDRNGKLKAPFSMFADEDINYDDDFVEKMCLVAEELKDRKNIRQAVTFINKEAPLLNGDRIDASKIKLFRVDLPGLGLGFPMSKDVWQPSELIYAYGKKVSNFLEIYVTQQFHDLHLQDNMIAMAEVIDHEYGENMLGQSHRVSATRARLFIPENEFLSPFHLFYIKLITRYKESAMEIEVLPDRVPGNDVKKTYANDEKSIKAISGYEKKFYRHYLMSKEFYADAQKSHFSQDESISYVIDGKTGKPAAVYISIADDQDIERLYGLDKTDKIRFLPGETVLKLYTKNALGKDKIRGGISLKKEKREKYGVPVYSIPNIVVEGASRTGQERRELKYLGWKLLEFAVKESLKDSDTGGAVAAFVRKDLLVPKSSLKKMGFKDKGDGVFLLGREDARAFLNKIDNLFKGSSWFIRMQNLSAKGKVLLAELSQKTNAEIELQKAIEAMAALSLGMEKKLRNAPLYPDIQKDLTVELINSRAALALAEAKKLKRISEGLNFDDFQKITAPLSSLNMLTYSRENLYHKYGARLLEEVDAELSDSEIKKALDYATFQSIYVAHSLITFLLVEYLMFQFPDIKENLPSSVRQALSDISVLEDEDSLFDSSADMLEDALNFMTSITEVAYDKNGNKERGLDHCWENEKIINNTKKLIPRLIQSMIKLSGTIAAEDDKRKVVVLLDSDISNISSGKIKEGLSQLINTLSTKKEHKRSLGIFLRNLEIRKGEGKELLSKKGNVPEKDIVVLTSSGNYELFESLEKKGSLLTVIEKEYEGEAFPQDAYLPLVEVLFLSLIKYMHINSDEDLQSMLVEIYNLIPNVIALDDLIAGEYIGITGKNTNKIIIRLIPDAKKFESADFTDPMERVLEFLVKA